MRLTVLGICVLLSMFEVNWCFLTGQTYSYKYTTTVSIDKPNRVYKPTKQNGSAVLEAVVQITTLWDREGDYLRKLEVVGSSVGHATSARRDPVQQLTEHPIYFSQKLGANIVVYRRLEDTTESVNIKHGIVNLLFYQISTGSRKEVDITGECDVTYARSGSLLSKVKTNCKRRQTTGQITNPVQIWDLNTTSTYETVYDIDDMLTLKSATCEETHLYRTDLDSRIGSVVMQRQKLAFVSSRAAETVAGAALDEVLKTVRGREAGPLVEGLLSSQVEHDFCESRKKDEASALVARHAEDLIKENVGLPDAAKAYIDLVAALRQTNKAAILELLNDPDNSYVINQLIDACVAAGSKDAQEALQEFIEFNDSMDQELAERYLLAMAFVTHPTPYTIQRLRDLYTKDIPNDEVRASTLLALGAVLKTFHKTLDRFTLPLLTETQNWFLEQLNACPADDCKIMFLGALANAALPGALPTVLYYAEHSEAENVNLAALNALSGYPRALLRDEAKSTLFRIYNQIEQPTALGVRIGAVDQLLTIELTSEEIHHVLSIARLLPNKESTAYVIKRILDRARNDEHYEKILRSDRSFYNYDILAVPGSSTALTNPLINARDAGSSYSLFLENTASGLLQKSITEFVAKSGNGNELPIVKVGVFTGGLDSMAGYFGGGSEEPTDGAAEPSAGLRLSLLGVGLRPIQFFSTHGEMMSALWNAPSEPLSALQGNILLHDHSRLLSLSNGLSVDVQLRSGLSFDLSGAVSVSLWNRQSDSFVRNSASFVLDGTTHLHSALFRVGLNYTAETSGEIHFTSEVDFYEMPMTMCMQMTMPQYEIRYASTRRTAVGTAPPYHRSTSRVSFDPGASYLLDPRNSRQCNILNLKKQST